jgi:uncharacterized repeat protein (TIGR01451 family)/fimbrial isopeptide formation D2 family protein
MRLFLAICIVVTLGFHAQAQTLTPAGTPIRNQASASFIGPNGDPGVTFSGVAETRVSPVYGMQIKPDASNAPTSSGSNFALAADASNDRIATPGGTVSFAYTVTNTGNTPDRYSLSSLQFAGDGFDLSNLRIVIDSNENGLIDNGELDFATSLDLNANAHASIIVSGQAPTTNNGARGKLDLTGSSLDNPSIFDNNNIARATINSDANLILNKEARLLTDGRIKYRIFGSNQGARAARSSLSGVIVDGTLYFGILLSDAIPANSVLDLLETPTATAGGATAARVIYQVGFGTWTATPGTTASSIGLFIPDKNATTGSPVTDTLNISGGYELTFHVRAKPGLRAGTAIANTALIQYRDSTNIERETISNTTLTGAPTLSGAMIGPQSQPTGTASGTYHFIDPSSNTTWTISRSRNGNDQTDQQNIESSNGSNTVSFVNTVQNTGNARDTLNVRFDPSDISSILPAGSSVQIYAPDGITPITNGLILEPNETADMIVRVTLPLHSNTPNVSAVIRTTSSNDPSKTDITRNTIGNLPKPDVLIGPFGAANASEFPDPADKQTLEPFEGAVARFPQTVRNNGNISDVMNLSLETPLQAGFTARWLAADGTPLTDTNNDGLVDTGLHPAGSEVNVILEISLPDGTTGNNGGLGWPFVAKVSSSADRTNSNRTLNVIPRVRASSEIWTVTKSVSSDAGAPAVLAPEAKLIYTLTVSNIGSLIQHDVRVNDTLNEWLETPTKISDVSVIDANGSSVALSVKYDTQTRKLEWAIPDFPANTSLSLTFHTMVRKATPDATVIPNTALVSSRDVPRVQTSNRVDVAVISPVLKLNKVALEGSVSIGGVVQFEIEARNNSGDASLSNLTISDFMPVGLVYRSGSSRLNNQPMPDPEVITENGVQTLRWNIGVLPAEASLKVRFAATATPAFPGEVVNQATARAIAANGAIIVESNKARASVKRANGIFSSSSTVVGRIYFDTDGNKRFDAGHDEVLPNARIYLSNGRYAISDNQGLYSFPDLEPGRYALRLDPLTVPFIAAHIPDDQCAPGTRPVVLEGDGLITKDFLLLPPSAAISKVRSTVLQLGNVKLEKKLRQGGAGYAVELTLTLDRNVANLTLSDPLPSNQPGSSPSERTNITLERLDQLGNVLETISMPFEPGTELHLGTMAAGMYRLTYALLTDLEPDQAVTDPDLNWNEVAK